MGRTCTGPGAHPRLRGEDGTSATVGELALGSSPATRGGRFGQGHDVLQDGLIPGYAGRTVGRLWTGRAPRAHPRLRGEDKFGAIAETVGTGSSPATRGGRWCDGRRWRRNGLIPGYAGRTRGAGLRSGGSSGSSPATRGGPGTVGWLGAGLGLIPGYAGRTGRRPSCSAAPRAHPRLRGEDQLTQMQERVSAGSSPATRGGLNDRVEVVKTLGLIPGYAGRTNPARSSTARTRAHPRLRGEDAEERMPAKSRTGSSPATRGGHQALREVPGPVGLIPGYAGRTSGPTGGRSRIGAHPRLRGEDGTWVHPFQRLMGSSPATRGGPSDRPCRHLPRRLIPGYAGRTGVYTQCPHWFQAHPRLRGEDSSAWTIPAGWSGSSPATRGGLQTVTTQQALHGLIPGYAGRTGSCGRRGSLGRAHPRLRGEDMSFAYEVQDYAGSSPATRGGRGHGSAEPGVLGLIPGYAGRTRPGGSSSSGPRAHPRLRGEDLTAPRPAIRTSGSSPATRGGHRPVLRAAVRGGLIPGYAGRTCAPPAR